MTGISQKLIKFVKVAIAESAIFLVMMVLFVVLCLSIIYAPYLYTFLILMSIVIPLGVIVLSPLMVFAEFTSSSLLIKKINMGAWKVAKFFSTALLCFCICLMFSVALLTITTSVRTQIFSNKTRFPLSTPDAIAVDKEGLIYLALGSHSRIQVYGGSGDYLQGWFVARGTPFNIWVEDDDLLHVHCLGPEPDEYKVFDSKAKLLKMRKITSRVEEKQLYEKAAGPTTKDFFGNTYSIQSSLWSPRIVKTSLDRKETVIIEDPFHLWLVQFPLPLFFIGVISMIMSFILGMIIKKKVSSPKIDTIIASSPSSELTESFPAD